MSIKENQRVMLTKRLIKESLIRLLATEDIYKISIHGLCEDAQINRSTFYKYYGSQYDVLAEMEAEMLTHIQKSLGSASGNPAQQVVKICSYLESNAVLVRLLTNNNIDPEFPSKLFNLPLIRKMLNMRLGDRYDEEFLDYASTFLISGGYSLMRNWINRDVRKSAIEIATLIIELEEKVLSSTASQA